MTSTTLSRSPIRRSSLDWRRRVLFLALVLAGLPHVMAQQPPHPDQSPAQWQLADAWGEPYHFPTPGKKAHVLVFWASWCPYCHELMPKIEDLYQELPVEKVEFLAINAWDSADPEAFMMEHDYRFPVLIGGEKIAPLYGIQAVPEVLVFNEKMQLLYRRQTGQKPSEVAQAVKKLVTRLLQDASQNETAANIGSESGLTSNAVDLEDALDEFYVFAEPQGGAIAIQQIPADKMQDFLWVDTRSQEKYQQGHIPGAIHMEWREVFERRDELPKDREIILYCTGGVVAAQAMMGLKLARFDNVHTLAGGYSRYLDYQRQQAKKQPER